MDEKYDQRDKTPEEVLQAKVESLETEIQRLIARVCMLEAKGMPFPYQGTPPTTPMPNPWTVPYMPPQPYYNCWCGKNYPHTCVWY